MSEDAQQDKHPLNIENNNPVEELIAALDDEKWYVRHYAAKALGEIGDNRAVEPLITALKDKEWVVRGFAAKALGQIGHNSALDPLIVALKDELPMRSKAARALGKIGDPRAIEPLIVALKDEIYFMRIEAIVALVHIGDTSILPELERVAREDEDNWVRNVATKAIELIKGRQEAKDEG